MISIVCSKIAKLSGEKIIAANNPGNLNDSVHFEGPDRRLSNLVE